MIDQQVIERTRIAFSRGALIQPALTLRAGAELDSYRTPSPFDPRLDTLTDKYLEDYAEGLTFLDPASWRFYLPHMMDFSLRHASRGARPGSSRVIDAVLQSLRPPDREPPRFSVLTPEQEAAIVAFLERLAMDDKSPYQDSALQVLEEYWIPGALYRKE